MVSENLARIYNLPNRIPFIASTYNRIYVEYISCRISSSINQKGIKYRNLDIFYFKLPGLTLAEIASVPVCAALRLENVSRKEPCRNGI